MFQEPDYEIPKQDPVVENLKNINEQIKQLKNLNMGQGEAPNFNIGPCMEAINRDMMFYEMGLRQAQEDAKNKMSDTHLVNTEYTEFCRRLDKIETKVDQAQDLILQMWKKTDKKKLYAREIRQVNRELKQLDIEIENLNKAMVDFVRHAGKTFNELDRRLTVLEDKMREKN